LVTHGYVQQLCFCLQGMGCPQQNIVENRGIFAFNLANQLGHRINLHLIKAGETWHSKSHSTVHHQTAVARVTCRVAPFLMTCMCGCCNIFETNSHLTSINNGKVMCLMTGELTSFSSKAFSAHTIVHVYFSLVDFSSQCALSTDAAARLDANNDCAIDADKLGNSCNQAGFAPVLLS